LVETSSISDAKAESSPNVLDEPHVKHWYGVMLLDRGLPEDRDRCRRLLSGALDGFRRIGSPVGASRSEEALARL